MVLPGIPGSHEEPREYCLEELKELLNKLMLMSGKKDHNNTEVERFSEVRAHLCSGAKLVASSHPWGLGTPKNTERV